MPSVFYLNCIVYYIFLEPYARAWVTFFEPRRRNLDVKSFLSDNIQQPKSMELMQVHVEVPYYIRIDL